jgi:TolB protein
MRQVMLVPLAALVLAVVPSSTQASVGSASLPGQVAGACDPANPPCFRLESTIALVTNRDDPTADPVLAAEIYLMNPDGTNPRRLTNNHYGDGFPALSPDGRKIVVDSNRNRAEDEPLNTSDLFLMNTDGGEQTPLTRGSSATWSPDSKNIAFHASASGIGRPIRGDAGAPTEDSDIFIVNVDDLLAGVEQPRNITSNGMATIDDDADWSPDGQRIVFTSHDPADNRFNSTSAEIYAINPDGTGAWERLTYNNEEERAPDWSPDGTRVVFMCRRGGSDFEICVMNADGSNQIQLTDNSVGDLTPSWSPDGQRIVFHRNVIPGLAQLWLMNADGTDQTQLTSPPGYNALANWGELRVHDPAAQ